MPAEVAMMSGSQGASGDFGGRLFRTLMENGGDLGALRTCAVLRPNEWILFDKTVQTVSLANFTLVKDLMAAGMRMEIPNALGVMTIWWDRIGRLNQAQWGMVPEALSDRGRLEFNTDTMPVPLVHHGFKLNIRHLLAARRNGMPLDTAHAQASTQMVVESIEDMFINGSFSAGAGSGTMYGILSYPYRVTGSLTGSWLSITPDQIFTDVNNMIAALEAKNQYGPYGMYIPPTYAAALRKDYVKVSTATGSVGSSKTIMQRLMDIEGLQFIRTNRFVPANTVVMIQMSPLTMEVMDGIQPRLIEWSDEGGFETHYKVIAIMLPRPKRDALDQSGLCHFVV